ncbi:MAG: aldehyde ferredoxin oxidoreductase family protein [Dehalococcoidales bacterium]|nr:aldehyde ferredoxin oxidoreductase family protein [Dehalococcoidales bacterium]
MVFGYNGKVLFIDLSSASASTETLPENICRDFIGGQGLGVRILYEHMRPKVDPLGPDNILGFVTGPLTGTGVHGARFQVVGKSPITGGWSDSNCGGSFANQLKATGYDAIFLTGVSPKPVYIFVNDGEVSIKDADHLWGKDTSETDVLIKSELADGKVGIACIGPAGEAKSLIAAILHEGCAAARGGLAAVMGSKSLKALVVRGTKKAQVADPERFTILRKQYLKEMKDTDDEGALVYKKYGTCGLFSACLVSGDTPIKNWTRFGEEGFPTFANLDGDAIVRYQTKKHACLGCPVGCKGWLEIKGGTYGTFVSTKIEYETLGMLGSNLLIDDAEAVAKANDLCNRYGLDTISTGAVIAFAMELYERGIIDKETTDGIELTWGNGMAMVEMVEQIGRREGFGAILADGSKFAAESIGKESDQYAMHVAGQDLPAHDPRVLIGCGWGYVLDATPGRHTACESANAFFSGLDILPYEELKLSHVDVNDVETNAMIYAICSDVERLISSAGICQFAYYPGILPIIELIKAVTDWDISVDEGLKAGRRIATLRQAFNIREGLKPGEWHLPKRIEEPQSSGPNVGIRYNFRLMKTMGYQALGWDRKTGRPLASTLEGLGLKDLIG